jgi:hypothetical protein
MSLLFSSPSWRSRGRAGSPSTTDQEFNRLRAAVGPRDGALNARPWGADAAVERMPTAPVLSVGSYARIARLKSLSSIGTPTWGS